MYIFISLTSALFVLLLLTTKKMNVILRIMLLVLWIISIFSLYIFLATKPAFRSIDKNWYEIGPWKHIILFFIMLLGMVTEFLFDYLNERIKAKKNSAPLPMLVWERLLLPIVVSGLIFGYFWGQHAKEPMNLAVVFISYQNGFFWQNVINKFK